MKRDGPTVLLPNNEMIQSNKTGYIPLHNALSQTAKTAHVFDDIKTSSLISLGKLADDGCTIILDKTKIKVLKNNNNILQGTRNQTDGLWDIPIPQQHKVNVILHKKQSNAKLIAFFHKCAFSPTTSTFVQAIKNKNFHSWPGLTVELVNKYLAPSVSTAKGHLDQEQSNLQSTKEFQDAFPPQTMKQNEILASIIPFKTKNVSYMDLTGRFPYMSSRGNEYIMTFYHYDANAILAEPIKNRSATEIVRAWTKLC